MKILQALALGTLLGIIVTAPTAALPSMAAPTGLSLLELKITGDELVLIQNNSGRDITNLNSYWLTAYNNVNPLASGVSSSTQQLPSAPLKDGQTLLLSASAMQNCGASVSGKLSVSLTDSGGFLQISQSAITNGVVMQTPLDMVSWSSGTSGIIGSVPSSTKDPLGVYFRTNNGVGYVWQQADLNAVDSCQLNVVVVGASGSPGAVTPLTLAATSPPATIQGSVASVQDLLPPADVGLNAPQLSEIMPNPNGTDTGNEFIELYNPNDAPFDLTGFRLQAGTHSYIFPAGSMLAARSFQTFYDSQTKLSLGNTSGQVALFDPMENILGTTTYTGAKEGYTWAIANNTWYWTVRPTPGTPNIIAQPVVVPKTAAPTKAAATPKPKATKTSTKKAVTKNAYKDTAATKKSSVASGVLVGIAVAAVLYGVYEYRRDLAHFGRRCITKLGLGRSNGQKSAGRRSD